MNMSIYILVVPIRQSPQRRYRDIM